MVDIMLCNYGASFDFNKWSCQLIGQQYSPHDKKYFGSIRGAHK